MTHATATTNKTDTFPRRFAFILPAHVTLPMMGKGRLHRDKAKLRLGTVRPRREGQPPRQSANEITKSIAALPSTKRETGVSQCSSAVPTRNPYNEGTGSDLAP